MIKTDIYNLRQALKGTSRAYNSLAYFENLIIPVEPLHKLVSNGNYKGSPIGPPEYDRLKFDRREVPDLYKPLFDNRQKEKQ